MTAWDKSIGADFDSFGMILWALRFGLLGSLFISWLFLRFFVFDYTVLRCVPVFRFWHASLAAMFAAYILFAFQVIVFRHC